MKKIVSTLLAAVMIISCFTLIPVTAQAATVTQTVKSFADMEDKISSKTIQPVLSKSNEKYESFSYQYTFTVDTAGYYMIMTSALSNGIQYSATGNVMNAKVMLSTYSSDLAKKYSEENSYFGSPNGSLYSRLYLEKGSYTVLLSRDQSTIYPAQTTNLYIAKLQSGVTPVTVSYVDGSQTVKLKINSIDTVEDLYISNSNGDRNPNYSWTEDVGEKFYLDSNSCVSIKLEGNRYAWLQIGVKDVYGIESVFEYQILNSYTANISGIKNKTYTGSAIKQSDVTIKAGYDNASYTTSYKNNVNVGTATAIFTGKGKTLGSVTKTFKIDPIGASSCSSSLSTTSYTYDGKVKKPSVTVKCNGKTLKTGTDYAVTYPSGRKNVGKYTITIKLKGNYSGTIKKSFTIKPKTTSISSLSAKSKGFTVKWKKQSTQTTGYQIQYSTSSKFSKAKTVTVSKNSTTSKTISKLSAKKKYYVRIRTYKTVEKTKYYSNWSKAKSTATKK